MEGLGDRPLDDAYRERFDRAGRLFRETTDIIAEISTLMRDVTNHLLGGEPDGAMRILDALEARLPKLHTSSDLLLQACTEIFAVYPYGMPQLAPEMAQLRAGFAKGVGVKHDRTPDLLRALAENASGVESHPVIARLTEALDKFRQELEYVDSRNAAILRSFDEGIILAEGTEDEPPVVDWLVYIHADPEILRGKPVVKSTRLSVRFLLDRLAGGWTEGDLLEEYPSLTHEGIRAVLAYAADQIPDRSSELATN